MSNEQQNLTEETKAKYERILYAFEKEAARSSFVEFLESWNLSEDDYDEFKRRIVKEFGLNSERTYFG